MSKEKPKEKTKSAPELLGEMYPKTKSKEKK